MTILIISNEYDMHANSVMWGLQKYGVDASLLDLSKFPSVHCASWRIGGNSSELDRFFMAGDDLNKSFDKIWFRRLEPTTPMPGSHPDDLQVIKRESSAFIDNVLSLLSYSDAFWINSLNAARRANQKALQLVLAREVGFEIPPTLIGNDFNELKNFFDACGGDIISKNFVPHAWLGNDGSSYYLATAALERKFLEHEFPIRACPNIYQKRIEKEYELRVTIIGNRVICARIDSQKSGQGIDWRYDCNYGLPPIELVQLPTEVQEKCLSLMRKLGLVFGCLDLIYSKNGEYVFLEINQAGQFLWQDFSNPEFNLLDVFCQYLAFGDDVPYVQNSEVNIKAYTESNHYSEFMSVCENASIDNSYMTNET